MNIPVKAVRCTEQETAVTHNMILDERAASRAGNRPNGSGAGSSIGQDAAKAISEAVHSDDALDSTWKRGRVRSKRKLTMTTKKGLVKAATHSVDDQVDGGGIGVSSWERLGTRGSWYGQVDIRSFRNRL
jgi:hypothetical protein